MVFERPEPIEREAWLFEHLPGRGARKATSGMDYRAPWPWLFEHLTPSKHFPKCGTCGNSQSGTYAAPLSDSTVIHCDFVYITTFSISYALFHKQAVQSDVDYRTPCVPFEPTGMDYRTPSPWTFRHLFLGFPSPFRGLSDTSNLRKPLCE